MNDTLACPKNCHINLEILRCVKMKPLFFRRSQRVQHPRGDVGLGRLQVVHRRGGQLFAVVQGRQDAARARQAAHLRRLHVLLPVAAGRDVPVTILNQFLLKPCKY